MEELTISPTSFAKLVGSGVTSRCRSSMGRLPATFWRIECWRKTCCWRMGCCRVVSPEEVCWTVISRGGDGWVWGRSPFDCRVVVPEKKIHVFREIHVILNTLLIPSAFFYTWSWWIWWNTYSHGAWSSRDTIAICSVYLLSQKCFDCRSEKDILSLLRRSRIAYMTKLISGACPK